MTNYKLLDQLFDFIETCPEGLYRNELSISKINSKEMVLELRFNPRGYIKVKGESLGDITSQIVDALENRLVTAREFVQEEELYKIKELLTLVH